MFIDSRSYGQYVYVEYYVFRRDSGLFRKKSVRPFAYLYLSLVSRCLTFFVKGHDDHGSSE